MSINNDKQIKKSWMISTIEKYIKNIILIIKN